MSEVRKIPTTAGLTSRQIRWLTTEAKGLGISMADMIRRIIDDRIPKVSVRYKDPDLRD